MQPDHVRAVVTGGVSGLGFAVAQHLVRNGGKVVLFDVAEDKAAAAVAELGEANARYLRTDVTDEAVVRENIAAASGFLGGLNVAVNCAGILGSGRVLGREGAMPLKTFTSTVMVNLVGSFNVAKAAAEVMQHNAPGEDGERGVIINTASVAAYEGQIGQAAYSASQGGVVGMTLPMAREFARFGDLHGTVLDIVHEGLARSDIRFQRSCAFHPGFQLLALLAVQRVERLAVPERADARLLRRYEAMGDEHAGGGVQANGVQALAYRPNPVLDVVRSQVQIALELAEAEHVERAPAAAQRPAIATRQRAGVHGEIVALPRAQALLACAPGGDIAGEVVRAAAELVAAAFDRLDQAFGRQPHQRDAHGVLADVQFRGDGAVPLPGGQQLEHFQFAVA